MFLFGSAAASEVYRLIVGEWKMRELPLIILGIVTFSCFAWFGYLRQRTIRQRNEALTQE